MEHNGTTDLLKLDAEATRRMVAACLAGNRRAALAYDRLAARARAARYGVPFGTQVVYLDRYTKSVRCPSTINTSETAAVPAPKPEGR